MGAVLVKGSKIQGEDPSPNINDALENLNAERNIETANSNIGILRVDGGVITEFPADISHPDLKHMGFSTGTEFSFIPDSASHLGSTTDDSLSCSSTAYCFFVQPALENAAKGNYLYTVRQ